MPKCQPLTSGLASVGVSAIGQLSGNFSEPPPNAKAQDVVCNLRIKQAYSRQSREN